MMNKNKFVLGAAAALALAGCGSPQRQEISVSTQEEYAQACGSYASWGSEAAERRREVVLGGGNPNADLIYRNQLDAAERHRKRMMSLQFANPGINETGRCEKEMVSVFYRSGRL